MMVGESKTKMLGEQFKADVVALLGCEARKILFSLAVLVVFPFLHLAAQKQTTQGRQQQLDNSVTTSCHNEPREASSRPQE